MPVMVTRFVSIVVFVRPMGTIGGASKRSMTITTILGFIEHECKMAMPPTPACCFDGCRDLRNLLPKLVYGGGHGLAEDFIQRHWCNDGPYSLMNGGFICCR